MLQPTLTERDSYVAAFDREYQTTRKLILAFPADQLDLQPSPKSKRARDLIWMLVISHGVPQALMGPALTPPALPPAPVTHAELLAAFDGSHPPVLDLLRGMSDEQFYSPLRMPVGPGQVADVPRNQALWMMLYDTIHHRGQLSVYVRMAGGIVPTIYGPTLEQPWW